MQQELHHHVIAGVALVGASMVSVTPITTPLPDLHIALTSNSTLANSDFLNSVDNWLDGTGSGQAGAGLGALDLAGLFDPWKDVFDQAKANAETVLPAVKDAQEAFIQSLAHPDTTPQELFNGLTFLDGAYQFFRNSLAHWTLDGHADLNPLTIDGHIPLYLVLTGQLQGFGFPTPAEPIPTLANLLASPLSGVSMGSLGPWIAPGVALINTVEAVIADLNGSNPEAALHELLNIPVSMTDGFLNGATLNLDSLIPLAGGLLPLPPGSSLDGLSLDFGGLLSPGSTLNGVGGSILNSVGMDLSGLPNPFDPSTPIDLDVVGQGVGPIGAMASLYEALAAMFTYDGNIPETTAATADLFSSADFSWLTDLLGL